MNDFSNLQKIETLPECVDIKFLEAMGFTIKVLKYYQIALEHPDLKKGRFMWYPTTGTLVHEGTNKNRPLDCSFFNSEDVYNTIMEVINK